MNLSLVTNSLNDSHLADFIKCYNADNIMARTESERFKKFSYDEIIKRDKVSLDITWLKDESLESLENLPEPEILADEIVDNLETALDSFKNVLTELQKAE